MGNKNHKGMVVVALGSSGIGYHYEISNMDNSCTREISAIYGIIVHCSRLIN